MASLIANLCDELVVLLNAADFGVECIAAKSYLPTLDLKGAGETVHLTVAPSATQYGSDTRGSTDRQVVIDIGVQRALPREATDDVIEAMLDLVERIARTVHRTRDAALGVVCREVGNDPIYSPEHIREKRLFTSVLQTTWEAEQ